MFFLSVYSLITSLQKDYRVSVIIEKDNDLANAENAIAEYFTQNNYDYLLMLDDDHSGHTKEMVDAMVKADADIVSMKYYCRHYPYTAALFNGRRENYVPIEEKSGVHNIEHCGFGMVMMNKTVFQKLEYPWFLRSSDGKGREWVTDQIFCERAIDVGLIMQGICDYTLTHAGINEENIDEVRNMNAPLWIHRYMASKELGSKIAYA
jgi:hypothetical protein